MNTDNRNSEYVKYSDIFKIKNIWGKTSYLNVADLSNACGDGVLYNVNTCNI